MDGKLSYCYDSLIFSQSRRNIRHRLNACLILGHTLNQHGVDISYFLKTCCDIPGKHKTIKNDVLASLENTRLLKRHGSFTGKHKTAINDVLAFPVIPQLL